MEDLTYEVLNINNEEELIEYEAALYQAFMLHGPDSWIINHYEIINSNRLKSKISYFDQVIYAIKQGSKIMAGIAVHLNVNKRFQLEEMGFKINKDHSTCEGLNLFSIMNHSQDFIKLFVNLGNLLVEDLKMKNKKLVYSTCPRRIKAIYSLMGFQVIDKKMIDNEKKLLLKFDLYDIKLNDYVL